MADVTITTTTKRTLDVAIQHGDGSPDTAIGDQFAVSGYDTSIVAITNVSRQTWIEGRAVGTTTVYATANSGGASGSFSVEVTDGTLPPPPAPDVLTFTFGAEVAQ